MPVRGFIAAIVVAALVPLSVSHGQKRVASFSAGALSFDASGTGSSYTLAGRVTLPLGSVFQVQPGLGYSPFEEQFSSDKTRMFFVDALFRAQATSWLVQPFLAVGPIVAIYGTNAGGRHSPETGYGIAAGLDARLRDALIGIVDVRFRGWQLNGLEPVNVSFEGTIGLGIAF